MTDHLTIPPGANELSAAEKVEIRTEADEIKRLRGIVALYRSITPRNIGALHDVAWSVLKGPKHDQLRRRTSIADLRTFFDELIPALAAAIVNNKEAAPDLLAALVNLTNNVAGCIGIAETELRAILSNTNVAVLQQAIRQANAAIANAEGR